MSDEQQTLTDHLTELRQRLMSSLIAILVGFGLCFAFSEVLFDLIRAPIAPFLREQGLVFTAPMDKFMAHLKVSALGGFVLACPWWLFQVWSFVAPGLYSRERKYSMGFMFCGSLLFSIGVSFVYFIVLPTAFEFLMNYGGGTDSPMITINDYLSFFITTTVVFGLAFELPLIMVLLGLIGIVNKRVLSQTRRYAVVVLAGLSAIITPPDIMSMLLLLIPLCLLYELGIFFVGVFEKKRAEN